MLFLEGYVKVIKLAVLAGVCYWGVILLWKTDIRNRLENLMGVKEMSKDNYVQDAQRDFAEGAKIVYKATGVELVPYKPYDDFLVEVSHFNKGKSASKNLIEKTYSRYQNDKKVKFYHDRQASVQSACITMLRLGMSQSEWESSAKPYLLSMSNEKEFAEARKNLLAELKKRRASRD